MSHLPYHVALKVGGSMKHVKSPIVQKKLLQKHFFYSGSFFGENVYKVEGALSAKEVVAVIIII